MYNIEEAEKDWEISRKLSRTWHWFFAVYGRLTKVQRESILPILDGKNVLICSATASGKTEAAFAPLIEKNINIDKPWTILYISPTRALVNDMYERLEMPALELGINLIRYTGDHRTQINNNIPNILLTTPESFDSLLCRGRINNNGHILSHVNSVIIDEVHLFYSKQRGEQIKWLLERLRRLKSQAKDEGWTDNKHFQIICLSATVQDPESVSSFFMPEHIPPIIIKGGRYIEIVTIPSESTKVESALPTYLNSIKIGEKVKVLVFCNSRKRVDQLTLCLRNYIEKMGYKVKAHHGSLSKKEREETEEAFKNNEKIVVVATQTLELGIDIGNVDLIVLDGPAPDISSLLQRIGRGNRRTNKSRVMACASSIPELILQSAMLDAAKDGWLGEEKFGPNHAVARQQIISYIYQYNKRARSKNKIRELINSCTDPIVCDSLLDYLIKTEELIESDDGIRLSDDWLHKADKGEIHSNIERPLGEKVIDEETGHEIAHDIKYESGRGLNIGGELLEVKKWKDRKIEVSKISEKDFDEGSWRYIGRKFVKSAGQSKAIRRYLEIKEDLWPIIYYNGLTYVFHFSGPSGSTVLELIVENMPQFHLENIHINELFIEFSSYIYSKPNEFCNITPGLLKLGIFSKLDDSKLDKLEYTLGRPYANKKLPLDLRKDEIIKWLNLEEELERIKKSIWETINDNELKRVLRSLICYSH